MPHRHDLKVFVVSKDQPAGPLRRGPTLSVEASTLGVLLPAAKSVLADAGFVRDRAISFSPSGLVAYVEEAP
jgi:hypothetical protein